VPLVAWLECEISRLCVDDFVTEERSHPPLKHVAVLVLSGMAMERCGQMTRWDGVLDERDAAAGLLTPYQEPSPNRTEVHHLAVARPDDPRSL